ncbi:MAG: phosphotransferase [Paludibacteraceae bacterium]|nr:phosphotransferase [Paludibacteraceae bacterium]
MLHGDFSLGNLIFEIQEDAQGTTDGKPYWIDLGRAVHGIPMFDLGHIQTLNWHERLFLGLLAKALFKLED